MANPKQTQSTWAILVAALLLGAPAHAALVVGADGKPIPRATDRITPKDAYRLVVGALDAVGLNIVPLATFLPTVDASTVVTRSAVAEPYVTALVRLQDLGEEEQIRLANRRLPGEVCDCVISAPETAVVTDRRSNIELLLGRSVPMDR